MYFTTIKKGGATDVFPILSFILDHLAVFNFVNLIGLLFSYNRKTLCPCPWKCLMLFSWEPWFPGITQLTCCFVPASRTCPDVAGNSSSHLLLSFLSALPHTGLNANDLHGCGLESLLLRCSSFSFHIQWLLDTISPQIVNLVRGDKRPTQMLLRYIKGLNNWKQKRWRHN